MPGRSANGRNILQNFSSADQDRRWNRFNYTALRPQLVTGPTPGALNVLPAIGVCAAMRREKGEAFGFPGGPSFVWESADADLVAEVMVWAAQSPRAANEAFNITNGDVFEWRNVWPAWLKPSVSNLGRTRQRAWRPTSRKTRMSGARWDSPVTRPITWARR